MKILVTGGEGFIGSNFIKYLLTDSEVKQNIQVINLDKQTYAARGKNINYMDIDKEGKYKFIKGDITDKNLVGKVFSESKPDLVFNFAAESHVDKSIEKSEDFIKTNIIGATNLFDITRKFNVSKIIQISTDEVYGSIKKGSFKENSKLNPSNPYSSSKASTDLIGLSYFNTYKLPIIITRSANNYGSYQFPEKLIPLFITNLIEGKKVPLMGDKKNPSLNVRDWLHVEDNCRAIWFISQNGKEGEIYNVSGENEKTNMELTELLLENFEVGKERVEYISHRLGHDFRYSISNNKLKKLGFEYKHKNLDFEIKKVIDWYKKNKDWWSLLK